MFQATRPPKHGGLPARAPCRWAYRPNNYQTWGQRASPLLLVSQESGPWRLDVTSYVYVLRT
jgi:hypothetical protein